MKLEFKELGFEIELYGVTDKDEIINELFDLLMDESEGEHTDDELMEQAEEMINNMNYEIVGCDSFEEYVLDNETYKDIESILKLQSLIEDVEEDEKDSVEAIMEVCDYSLEGAIDAFYNGAEILDFSNEPDVEEALGEYYVEQGLSDIPERLEQYIDYKKLGSDLIQDYCELDGILVRV